MQGINLYVLEEDLGLEPLAWHQASAPWDIDCTHPLLYVAGMDFFRGPLYVARAADLPAEPPQGPTLNLVVLGMPPAGYLAGPHNVLVVDDTRTPVELYNDVMGVFQRYGEWERALDVLVDAGRPLKDLGRASLPVFGNPINLWTPGFKSLFYVIGDINAEANLIACDLSELMRAYGKFKSHQYLDEDDLRAFAGDREFGLIAEQDYPGLYDGREKGLFCRSLVYAVRASEEVCAYLIIDEVNRPLTERDVALAVILGARVGRMLAGRGEEGLEASVFGDMLETLLSGGAVSPAALGEASGRIGWSEGDRSVLWVVEGRDGEEASANTHALKSATAQYAGQLFSLHHDGRLVLLRNLTRCEALEGAAAMEDLLSLACRVGQVGMSEPFENLAHARAFYDQALAALSLGDAGDSRESPLRYADVYAADMVRRCRGDLPLEACVPECLRRLVRYDAEHGTELVPLLRTYLDNNLNVSQTARDRFLHRNSCMAKLARATEIVGCDLSDPDEVLGLRIALRLL